MSQSSSMVTSRLPQELVDRLDRVARHRKRSRSWLIKDALESYLSRDSDPAVDLMSYAGAGANLSRRRTAEQVETEIRWLRDDRD